METQRRRTKPETDTNAMNTKAREMLDPKISLKGHSIQRDVTIRKRSPSSNAISSNANIFKNEKSPKK